MERNFLEEFKAKMKMMELPVIEKATEKPFIEKREKIKGKLYNIHKRSLPVGIDAIVVFSVTEKEAKQWTEKKLVTRCYENGPDNSKTLIYYDIIPVDAKPREISIYANMGKAMQE